MYTRIELSDVAAGLQENCPGDGRELLLPLQTVDLLPSFLPSSFSKYCSKVARPAGRPPSQCHLTLFPFLSSAQLMQPWSYGLFSFPLSS